MRFSLTIESENAAMVDATWAEVQTMLRAAAEDVGRGCNSGTLRDSNGNRVGSWSLEGESSVGDGDEE